MSEQPPQHRWEKVLEILEVSVLAIVAIATAFSGYEGTKWGGEQARLYGLASSTRLQADAAATLGGQQLVADSSIFTAWLQAHDAGNSHLQRMLEDRFTPDYADAFREWLVTDPFTSSDAPPGPAYMPGFANPSMTKANKLNAQASALFNAGTEARENANKFVRQTVLFASVLFAIALAAVPAPMGADRRERAGAGTTPLRHGGYWVAAADLTRRGSHDCGGMTFSVSRRASPCR